MPSSVKQKHTNFTQKHNETAQKNTRINNTIYLDEID